MKVLAGHTGPVNAVCMTPDGKQAVSSSDDKTLRVWSLDSGKCVVLCLGDQFKSTAAQVTGLVANMGAGRGAMITMENFSLARPVTTAVRLWLSIAPHGTPTSPRYAPGAVAGSMPISFSKDPDLSDEC